MVNTRRFAMAAPVLLRGDYDAATLRGLARKTKDGHQTRRLLALAEIYDGGRRGDAAQIGGVGLPTVRDWVLRFNAEGPGSPGRSEEQDCPAVGQAWNAPLGATRSARPLGSHLRCHLSA